jgi:hypothetical protein
MEFMNNLLNRGLQFIDPNSAVVEARNMNRFVIRTADASARLLD